MGGAARASGAAQTTSSASVFARFAVKTEAGRTITVPLWQSGGGGAGGSHATCAPAARVGSPVILWPPNSFLLQINSLRVSPARLFQSFRRVGRKGMNASSQEERPPCRPELSQGLRASGEASGDDGSTEAFSCCDSRVTADAIVTQARSEPYTTGYLA